MTRTFHCYQGHQWEVNEESSASLTHPQQCLTCGSPHQASISDSCAPTDLKPSQENTCTLFDSLPLAVPGYEILEELGRGGMGVVYKARQVSLNRTVALKMILAGAYAGEKELTRFHAEAEAVARLQHPNIVQIHEIGQWQGKPFLSLEYIDGGSLAERLKGRPLHAREAARLVQTLAQGVHTAHQRGIVHRDLKPGNVLLAQGGSQALGDCVPKITDFGLAKNLEETDGPTRTGAIIGTPSYMAPEQARGANREVGSAADIYSLGAVLYELVTGRPPFRAATSLDTLYQVLYREPVSPRQLNPSVDRDLETVTLKCLEKEPGRRYPTAQALADDLGRYLDHLPVQARPVGLSGRLWRWAKRNPAVAALTGAVALLLLAGTAVSAYFAVQAEARAREARSNEETARDAGQRAEKNAADARAKEQLARNSAEQVQKEKERAEAEKGRALRLYYGANAVTAQRAWHDANLVHLRALLEVQQPREPGAADFRRFEWHYLHGLCYPGVPVLRGGWHTMVLTPDGRTLALLEPHRIHVRDRVSGRLTVALPSGNSRFVPLLAVAADGRRLLTAREDRTVILWQLPEGKEIRTFRCRAGEVRSLALSPDGKRAAAADERAVLVWDADTGKELSELEGHSSGLVRIALSPDGRRLAVASLYPVRRANVTVYEHQVKLWDLEPRKAVTLKGHAALIGAVAYSPNGKWLASASQDRTVKIWDVAQGLEVLSLQGHLAGVEDVTFSRDSIMLATACSDHIVRVWEAPSGRLLRQFRGHASPVLRVALFHDGRPRVLSLSARSYPAELRTWDATRDIEASTLTDFGGSASPLAYSPDGQWLATGSGNRVTLWARNRGRGGWGNLPLGSHAQFVTCVCFSPDGKWLASGATDGTVKLWELAARKEVRVLRSPGLTPTGISFGPDGRRLAVSFYEDIRRQRASELRVWDTATGNEVLKVQGVLHAPFTRVAYSPDGQWLATVSGEAHRGEVILWNAVTGRKVRGLAGHAGPIYDVIFRPDGKRLATAGNDQVVRVWDVEGQEVLALRGHSGGVFCVAFSKDCERLATGGQDQLVKVWDAQTGQELLSLPGHAKWVRGVAFHPGGLELASADDGGTVRVWETSKRPVALTLHGSTSGIQGLACTTDGRLASVDGREVRLWDLAARKLTGTLRADREMVRTVALSPDGRRLAAVGNERVVRLWDLLSEDVGREVVTLRGHTNFISSVAFSADGGRLVSAGMEGRLKVWDLKTLRAANLPSPGAAGTVSFSPDGRRLAAVGAWVEVLDAGTGKTIYRLRDGPRYASRVAFSADGRYLAAGGSGDKGVGEVVVWEAATGKKQHTLTLHAGSVGSVCFSPAGRLLAAGDSNGSIHLWDAGSGQPVATLNEHLGPVQALAFTPDGKTLISGSEDTTIKLWDLAPLDEGRQEKR